MDVQARLERSPQGDRAAEQIGLLRFGSAIADSRVVVYVGRQALVRWLDADDDVADLLPCLDVSVGLNDLVQRICSVDDRLELSGLDQLLEIPHHLLVMLRYGEHDLLAAMEWGDERQERTLGQRTQFGGDIDSARFQEWLALAEGALTTASRTTSYVCSSLVNSSLV